MARTIQPAKPSKATPKSSAKKGGSSVKSGSKPSLEAPLVVSGKRSVKKPERRPEEGYDEEKDVEELIEDDEDEFMEDDDEEEEEEDEEDVEARPASKKGKSQKVPTKAGKAISFKPKAAPAVTKSRASGRVRTPKHRDPNEVFYDAEGQGHVEEEPAPKPAPKAPAAKASAKKAAPPPPLPPSAPASNKKGSAKKAPPPPPAPKPAAKKAAPKAKVAVKGGVAKKASVPLGILKGKRNSTSAFSRR